MRNGPRSRLGQILIIAAIIGLAFGFSQAGLELAEDGEEFAMEQSSSFLIDDFLRTDGASAIGTEWRMFTDRVMGGVSEGKSGFENLDGRRCLRLQGRVSLENNGGFIQVALPLAQFGRTFDASEYQGVRVWGHGNGKTYHIHLRTSDTRQPWQYYGAAFSAGDKWEPVNLPFARFKPENLSTGLNTKQLARIAVVAIGEAFEADIAVSKLELYR